LATRREIEELLRALYAARIDARIEELCGLFTDDASFRISGSSEGKPIAVSVRGSNEIRLWLSMMAKSFKISRYQVLSMIIDGTSAAVQWRADINSRITGTIAPTELIDLIEVRDARIRTYVEFFVPC